MASGFSIKAGNFLYKYFFAIYKIVYPAFKRKQDKFEIELLQKHIKPGDVVLDIGANIGFYATILSDLVGPKGRVHCFEPDQTNFKHLKKAAKKHFNIISNNLAVGPKTEIIKMYTSKNLNVDHRTYKPEEYDKEMDIRAISIDDYLPKDMLVDFIKMDIQGFEMQAVKGMINTLKLNPKLKMVSEFWPYGLRKAGSSLSEYFIFLKDMGFDVKLFLKDSLVNINLDQVKQLEPLGEEHYFNIFVSRNNV